MRTGFRSASGGSTGIRAPEKPRRPSTIGNKPFTHRSHRRGDLAMLKWTRFSLPPSAISCSVGQPIPYAENTERSGVITLSRPHASRASSSGDSSDVQLSRMHIMPGA
jgi:hypothetical protein